MKTTVLSLLLVLFVALSALPAPIARITGQVVDIETGEGVLGANVLLVGTTRGAACDLDGAFSILALDPGLYDLRASAVGYEPTLLEGIRLEEGQQLLLEIELTPSAVRLEEVVVTGQSETGSEERELAERLENVTITDAISAETIARLPDPDVANVVRRATGVSTLGGDPVIRGLGARYSKVTLNSAQVSGTEPNRSAVSLSLFPASVMSNVNVSKSYTPDQWGEFGGGSVNMNTWDLPAGDLQINASTSWSYRDGTTGQPFYSYAGGETDWLALEDGTRELPAAIDALEQFDEEAPYAIDYARRMSNNWGTYRYDAPVNQGYNLSLSKRFNAVGRDLDVLASLLYDRSSTHLERDYLVIKGGAGGQPEVMHEYSFDEYKQNVTAGGLLNLRYQLHPLHRLSVNTLYNRDLEDETRFFEGFNGDRSAFIRDTRLRYVQQVTSTSQLSGSHAFPTLLSGVLDWNVTYSRGERYEPDTREVQYQRDEDDAVFTFADEEQSGSRFFNDLTDDTWSGGVDAEIRPVVGVTQDEMDLRFKFGAAVVDRERSSDTRFFEYKPDIGLPADVSAQHPTLLFSPNNIHPYFMMLEETTRPTDNYAATMNISAGYVMAMGRLNRYFRGSVGARVEQATQEVNTFALFDPENATASANLENTDVMPALTVIYEPWERTNLRLAASRTVSRPDFRELSPFEFTDIIGGRAVLGNPDLERALIDNYDLRFEKVFGVSNLVAFSVFYKDFHQPIETILRQTAQISETFANAVGATSYGVEMEWRQNLGFFAESLDAFSIATNLSLLESSIELGAEGATLATSSDRPLEGQSPYLFNFNVSYLAPLYGTNADLFVNSFGKRLIAVGYNGLPDEYELPHWEVDLTVRQPITDRLSLKMSGKNLADPLYEIEAGEFIVETYRKGRSVSVGLSWSN